MKKKGFLLLNLVILNLIIVVKNLPITYSSDASPSGSSSSAASCDASIFKKLLDNSNEYQRVVGNYVKNANAKGDKNYNEALILSRFLGNGIFYHTTSATDEKSGRPVLFEEKGKRTPHGPAWFSSVDSGKYFTDLYHSDYLRNSRTIVYRLKQDLTRLPKILDLSDQRNVSALYDQINAERAKRTPPLPPLLLNVDEEGIKMIKAGKAIGTLSGRGSYLDRFPPTKKSNVEANKYVKDFVRRQGYDGVYEGEHGNLGASLVFINPEDWLEIHPQMETIWHDKRKAEEMRTMKIIAKEKEVKESKVKKDKEKEYQEKM